MIGPQQLLQEFGREATPDELSEEMDLPVDRVRAILKIAQQPISLQSPIGDSELANCCPKTLTVLLYK